MAREADFKPCQTDPSRVRPPRVGKQPAAGGPGAAPVHCAAVDLGSNTFHLLLARIDQGESKPLERLKIRVGLAAGLLADGTLDRHYFTSACGAMRRIAERMAGIPPERIRAVGTSTLRVMRDPSVLLDAAADILGVPVRVISGEEEAELVFAGAAESLPKTNRPRLVIDIGGGSTELALGRGYRPRVCLSLPLGCVRLSRTAWAGGQAGGGLEQALAQAREICAAPELDAFVGSGLEVVGTSGTIESVRDVLWARGAQAAGNPMTLSGLRGLFELLAAAPTLPLALPGLDPEREDVFPGGLLILIALWERLGFDQLSWTEGALQEGLIRELLAAGREPDLADQAAWSDSATRRAK